MYDSGFDVPVSLEFVVEFLSCDGDVLTSPCRLMSA